MERVSAVVITFNSSVYLPRCAEGMAQQTHPLAETLIIDNASSDGSAERARELFAGARVIVNDRNSGFAAAANQAIAATSGELVLFLNPDVFLEPDYVTAIVRALGDNGDRFGAAAGKLLRGRGEGIEPTSVVDSKGIRMTRSGRHLDIAAGESDGGGSEAVEVFGVSGAAAIYRRSFLENVAIDGEPFDSDFFAYREDADIAWRGRLFGWKALYVPSAVAYHIRRVTPEARRDLSAEINMHSVKNRFLLRLKNEGAYLALRNAPFEIARDLVVLAAIATVERSSLPALGWLWQHRSTVMRKRRAIQSRRRVSDRELAAWFGR
jgi:GT2 family glycosyltransferase